MSDSHDDKLVKCDMFREAALQLASQAWCRPTTSDIEMDTRLAESFAVTLQTIALATANGSMDVATEILRGVAGIGRVTP